MLLGIITIWNLTSGSQIRTFESLRYSQTNDGSSLQVYTDLFLSLHHLVGVTSDHDIIIYDINTFRKIKHVCMYVCIMNINNLIYTLYII